MKMNRRLLKHLIFILVIGLLPFAAVLLQSSAQQSAIVLTREEKSYLERGEPIVFISQTNYPPFEFVDENGARNGMMIELARWLGSEIGFHADFVDAAFLEAQQAVLSGKADVLTSFFYSEVRDRSYGFTEPVFAVPASIFVAADRPDITGILDLHGQRIAMQQGDYAAEFLKENKIEAEVVLTANFAEATTAVIEGRADAVIGDEQIVLYHLYRNKLNDRLKKVGQPLYTGLNSMAVKRNDQLLQSILNKGIVHARETGQLDRLTRKWVGTSFPDRRGGWQGYWVYAVVPLVLLAWFGYWHLRLRQLVSRQTAELRRSKQHLTHTIDGTRAGTWEWNIQTGEGACNERWAEIAGYRLAELEPINVDTWRKLLHPDDLKKAEEILQRHFSGALDYYHCETRLRHKDGHWVWVDDRGRVSEWTAAGKPLLMAGTHLDISERKQTEEALGLKSLVLDQISDLVTVTDVDGIITYVNQTTARSLGSTPEEMIGQSVAVAFRSRPEQLERHAEVLEKTLRDGHWRGEFVNYRADGSARIVDLRTQSIRDSNGNVVALCGIATDITERKAAAEALKQAAENQSILLDNIRTQIFYLRNEHCYGDVNQAHADFFGVAKEDLAFKDIYDLLPAEAAEICRMGNREVFTTGKPLRTEEAVIDGKGEMRLLSVQKFPKLQEDGRVEYVVCSAEDITERKAAEAALQRKNEEMERFVYSVSHDLKSPLITVQSFLGMLKQDIAAGDGERISVDIDYINGAVDKMEKLLAALLQLSRIGRLGNPPEILDVETLISECLAALAGAIQQRKITIEVADMPVQLHGDPLRLGQIWQNLIENAIKYMGDQATPRIEIGVEQKEGETRFFVRDNGIGIPREHGERVFGLFTQVDSRNEGIGLGLALVKKIVEMYGGSIRVESEGAGTGSCFIFTLPHALAVGGRS